MKKTLIVIILTIIFLSGCAAKTVYIRTAPPNRKTEIRTERPGPKHFWIEGHWRWNHKKNTYKWIPGHWVKKREGKTWVHGSWKQTPRGWKWVESYWK